MSEPGTWVWRWPRGTTCRPPSILRRSRSRAARDAAAVRVHALADADRHWRSWQDAPGRAASRTLLDTYPDGVWLVELAPVADPNRVGRAVAGMLGVADVTACRPCL